MSNESHITESIHISTSMPKRNKTNFGRKQNEFNPNSQPFIHFYEENIKLKKKQQEMNKEVKQLKQKIVEQSKVNRTLNQRELKLLATGKKSLWDTKHPAHKMPTTNKQDSQKVQHLLEIIDHYKNKMMTSEEEIENLKRKIHLLQQDLKVKDKKSDQIMRSFQQSSNRQPDHTNLSEQLKSSIKQLQLQKERNRYNQAQIKRLQTKLRSIQVKEEDFDQIKLENRNLEEKLMRLTSLPSFGNVIDKVDEERKVKEIQSKYKLLNDKYSNLKNTNVKIQADLKILQHKLIEVSHEADTLQKQNSTLKQKSFSNPILQKLSNDPDLLSRVVYKIEEENRPTFKTKVQKQSYEQIIMEKEQLANELISLRAKMEALQENWKEKERLSKIQRQQMMTKMQKQGIQTKRDAKVVSKDGVPYSDDVSMFTQDSTRLPNKTNSFDLFLGELYLMETMIKTSAHIQNTQHLLVIAAVDFYNHDTVNTVCQTRGTSINLQSQFSFTVNQDEFFFRYLQKGNFYIDIWATQGSNKHHIGKTTIDLKSIINKSKPKLAPVISASAPIYLDNKVMGSINFVMRMRMPIHEQIEKISELGQMIQSTERSQSRRLIIHIEEGRGFNDKANTFVYYPFRLEDYYTKTYKGANPVWNHYKSIDLKYNEDLKNYLRKNQLELVVLDDNAMLSAGQGSDFIGNAYVSLIPLLESKTIKQRLHVMKGSQTMGYIDIRIFWHTSQLSDKKKQVNKLYDLHDKIQTYMRTSRYDAEDIFRFVDKNKTGMISFNEFHVWSLKIDPDLDMGTVNKYYNSFKQPVNLTNFVGRLNQVQKEDEEVKDIAKEMSMINEFMKKNTFQIKKKLTLEEFLKGKDIVEISLDIDKSQNGKISKEELQEYFQQHNIQASIDQQQINIVDFLKKYQGLT